MGINLDVHCVRWQNIYAVLGPLNVVSDKRLTAYTSTINAEIFHADSA